MSHDRLLSTGGFEYIIGSTNVTYTSKQVIVQGVPGAYVKNFKVTHLIPSSNYELTVEYVNVFRSYFDHSSSDVDTSSVTTTSDGIAYFEAPIGTDTYFTLIYQASH